MRGFEVTEGQLCVGGVPLQRLAQPAGQTPFYAYDRGLIQRRGGEVRAVPRCHGGASPVSVI